MKYKLLLAYPLIDAPRCWKGFLNILVADGTVSDLYNVALVKYVNKKLELHHAKYIKSGSDKLNDYLIFETEADAIIFKLKFG